ncbi:uncharacterized protein EI97DRAFT_66358 [Westerdykella ornata]|uniref:Uncharacterized protein n=1 Tax=Westerdykella ornata TaxID=318751 RepID=A0A6A6JIY8_WESOR|nr:uncharacterized protein EI97DRAFT_66358 [Westerdykella ornata]KAF2275626.1 hypothetical protein EI97DRAFT_66358 [Westerdykella ornata]
MPGFCMPRRHESEQPGVCPPTCSGEAAEQHIMTQVARTVAWLGSRSSPHPELSNSPSRNVFASQKDPATVPRTVPEVISTTLNILIPSSFSFLPICPPGRFLLLCPCMSPTSAINPLTSFPSPTFPMYPYPLSSPPAYRSTGMYLSKAQNTPFNNLPPACTSHNRYCRAWTEYPPPTPQSIQRVTAQGVLQTG